MTAPAPLVAGRIGTPGAPQATRALLLGAGELGKEVALELQRLGVEVAAADRYAGAPAMAVAHRYYVIPMLDGAAIRRVVEDFAPHLIVPEIEAIHTPTLEALEAEGWQVVPTARAARLTMDREGIRRLAAEALQLPTSPYRFADTYAEYAAAVAALGTPCVVKPVMSSSGKGQSVVKSPDEAAVRAAWDHAQSGGRTGPGRVIVEGFVAFDYEVTLLTVRHAETGAAARTVTTFCPPVGHVQVDGDYRESWQPHPMSAKARRAAEDVAHRITEALGGRGLFGVELFVRGDDVLFSEVSPRPHDTGLVTLAGQELSEFALHARAILGLPIPDVGALGPAASAAILFEGEPRVPVYTGLGEALAAPGVRVLLFGKPEIVGKRRMGVALARGADVAEARERARRAAAAIGRAGGQAGGRSGAEPVAAT